jgi:hypothetical protein
MDATTPLPEDRTKDGAVDIEEAPIWRREA